MGSEGLKSLSSKLFLTLFQAACCILVMSLICCLVLLLLQLEIHRTPASPRLGSDVVACW